MEKVVLEGGYLKDGYLSVVIELSYNRDFTLPSGRDNILIKFLDSDHEYVFDAHRFVDAIIFLSGE